MSSKMYTQRRLTQLLYLFIPCPNIYFNKQCLLHGLTPKYANIRVPHTSSAAPFTQRKLIKMRLKDELKFLYTRKTELNKQLYHMHLRVANEWDTGMRFLFTAIVEKLTMELSQSINKYKGCVTRRCVYILLLTEHKGCSL